MAVRKINWVKGVLLVGLSLGLVMLVQGVLNYLHVRHLVLDHLEGEAGAYVTELESLGWLENPEDERELSQLLDRVRIREDGRIAWIKVCSQTGQVLAKTDGAGAEGLSQRTLESMLEDRVRIVARIQEESVGSLLVVTLPFRYRLAGERTLPEDGPGRLGRPRFNLVELALSLSGRSSPFEPLQRNLVISIVAAVALATSMLVFLLRLDRYQRGQKLDQQMQLARQVQQDLLPARCCECKGIEFSAICVPAEQVGGDYYDVFRTVQGTLFLAFGDVSGKGLPAALVMSLIHGAVRTASHAWQPGNLGLLVADLNELLLARTAQERFTTLFWAVYSPDSNKLFYVNAGHLPPFLVRRSPEKGRLIERLDIGGPVLGLLPGSVYEQGEVELQPGDLLVLYSDGLVETTDVHGIEFGEERLQRILEESAGDPIEALQQEILESVTEFSHMEGFVDDLTLLMASRSEV
jgi:sigma-B regulation protein RsbU (phosphoserine phosphatase)